MRGPQNHGPRYHIPNTPNLLKKCDSESLMIQFCTAEVNNNGFNKNSSKGNVSCNAKI